LKRISEWLQIAAALHPRHKSLGIRLPALDRGTLRLHRYLLQAAPGENVSSGTND
jgi:hypothetical protein